MATALTVHMANARTHAPPRRQLSLSRSQLPAVAVGLVHPDQSATLALQTAVKLRAGIAALDQYREMLVTLLDDRTWLRQIALHIAYVLDDLAARADNMHTKATKLVRTDIVGMQSGIVGSAFVGFTAAMVVAILCVALVLLVLFRPGTRASRSMLVAGSAGQWIQAVLGCMLGGVALASTFFAMDTCVLGADFASEPGAYFADPFQRNVTTACLLSPPKPVVGIVAAHFAGPQATLALDVLERSADFGVQLPIGEMLSEGGHVRTYLNVVRQLTWRDFGLSVTRTELLERCCPDAELELAADSWPARCNDDGWLRASCNGALHILDANETARRRVADLQARTAEIDAGLTELQLESGLYADRLRRAGTVLEPLRGAVHEAFELGDCSFMRARYASVYDAACGAAMPSLFWIAAVLLGLSGSGIVLSVLLARLLRQSLRHMSWQQLAPDMDGADEERQRRAEDGSGTAGAEPGARADNALTEDDKPLRPDGSSGGCLPVCGVGHRRRDKGVAVKLKAPHGEATSGRSLKVVEMQRG
mmetsp:Transcript_15964/g.41281  ORF Transcript_15964/g.41281 Transcript_15964/m.41281 type:complete len:536 (+) Transcript_15964:730-2337(+)